MSNVPILSSFQVADALSPFGVSLTAKQIEAIQAYTELLLRWNRFISLTTIEDPVEIVTRHFGESLFVRTIIPLQLGRLADVGTGAGFPGLALKIAFPDLSVVLLEPNLKKCAFLNEVKATLGLQEVEVVRSRFEDYRSDSPFNFICARALGNYKSLLRWAKGSIDRSGMVALWLGTEDSLLVSRTEGWSWGAPVRIPESRRRMILCGSIADGR